MFTTREMPWMKLGTVIDEPVDSATAAKLGGLDFTVSMRDIQFAGPMPESSFGDFAPDPNDRSWFSAPSRKAVVRDDTGEFFDIVSADYKPLQYAQAFDFLDGINPVYTAAGTIKDGRQGFMVIKWDDADISVGTEADPHQLFVIVRTSHDRSRGIEISVMPVRSKCMNSLGLSSFSKGAEQRWSITHTGNLEAKLHSAQEMIARTKAYANEYNITCDRLRDIVLDTQAAETILDRVIPSWIKTRVETAQTIIGLWRNAETVALGDTGWGLVNAVSEYFEWNRQGGTAQSQMLGVMEGQTIKAIDRTAALVLSRA